MNTTPLNRTIAPAVCPPEVARLPQVRHMKLDNGIDLLVYDRNDMELMSICALTRGGEAEASNPAIATLAATMRSEGTAGMTSGRIADAIDSAGSWLMTGSQPHFTTTGIYALNRKALQMMPLLRDIVFNPVFPEKELAVTAGILASKTAVNASTVGFQCNLQSRRLMFGEGHPLARFASPESIHSITRSDIAAFHSTFTTPANTTLLAVGRITPQLEDTINTAFGSVRNPSGQSPLNIVPFQFPGRHIHSDVPVKDATQCAVTISLPGIPRSDSRYLTLRLAVMALGGYFGSRLSQNIREDKGLTYGISGALLGYDEGGVVEITAKCSPLHVDALIEESLSEVSRLAAEPLSDVELECLRQAEIASLTSVTDSPYASIDFYRTIITGNLGSDYFDRRIQAVNSMTSKHIADIAADCLKPHIAVTVVAGR